MTCFVSKASRITLVELSIINTSYQYLKAEGSNPQHFGLRIPQLVQYYCCCRVTSDEKHTKISRTSVPTKGVFLSEHVNPAGNGNTGSQVQHLKEISPKMSGTKGRHNGGFPEPAIQAVKENELCQRSTDTVIVNMSIV